MVRFRLNIAKLSECCQAERLRKWMVTTVVYIIAGWRSQHIHTWLGTPEIKSLRELKGKRVGISDFNSNRHWGIQIQLRKAGLDLERMPFPIDGLATGFEDMLAEKKRLGALNYEVSAVNDVCAQDLTREAFKELRERKELEPEYQRGCAIAHRWGY